MLIQIIKSFFKKIIVIYKGKYAIIASIISGLILTLITIFSIMIVYGLSSHSTLNKKDFLNTTTSSINLVESEEITTFNYDDFFTEPITESSSIKEPPTTAQPTTSEVTAVVETIPIEDIIIATGDGEDGEPDEIETQKEEEIIAPVEKKIVKSPVETTTEKKSSSSTDTTEISKTVIGIDVSKHQGEINWSKVKDSGVKFAIIRVAYRGYETGSLYYDKYFTENIENALKNGIQVGVYFFSQAVTIKEAQEEASMLLSAIKKYKITFPVVFDWETSAGWRTSIPISKNTMDSIASTFCNIVKNAGYMPMIYGNIWDLSNRYNIQELSSKYKIWLARYLYSDIGISFRPSSLPEYNYPYQMWQYSSKGIINGINTYVDINMSYFYFNGTSVPSAPCIFNLTNTSFITNTGTLIDPLNGVTALNSAGIESISSVSYLISDSDKKTVTLKTACTTPGTYSILYTFTDFTGVSINKTAQLTVRGNPVILVDKESITTTDILSISQLMELINNNIISAIDYEENIITDLITITYSDELNSLITNELLLPGIYTFDYNVIDKSNLSTIKTITLIIKDTTIETTTPDLNGETYETDTTTSSVTIPEEPETTTEETTSNETATTETSTE